MVQLLTNIRQERADRAAGQDAPRTVRQGAPGVLIADDDDDMRQVIRGFLVQAGFNRVYEARDGSECVAMLQQYPDTIRAIILDLMMPNLSGAHVLEQLGEISPPSLSVLLISGHEDSLSVVEQRYRNKNLPFRVEALGKPFEAEELIGQLKRMIMLKGGPSALVGLGAPLEPEPADPTPHSPAEPPAPVMQPMKRTVSPSAPAPAPADLDNLRKQLTSVEGQLAGLNTAVAQLRRAFDTLARKQS